MSRGRPGSPPHLPATPCTCIWGRWPTVRSPRWPPRVLAWTPPRGDPGWPAPERRWPAAPRRRPGRRGGRPGAVALRRDHFRSAGRPGRCGPWPGGSAAVVGTEVDADLLGQVGRLAPSAVADAMTAARASGLLTLAVTLLASAAA